MKNLWFKSFEQKQQVLPKSTLKKLFTSLTESPYLQKNVLNARFASTQGFSLLFESPEQLPDQFSVLAPFIELLNTRSFNYFYLNILQLESSAHVDRHVDHSIRGYGPQLPLPKEVSILYVRAEGLNGGDLLLYNRYDDVMHCLTPTTGKWVRFKGHIKHAITPLLQTQGPRLSLVCEQYKLTPKERSHLPAFALKSTAGFDTFLQQALPDS